MIRTVHFNDHDPASMAWAITQVVASILEWATAQETEIDFLKSKLADLERDRDDNAQEDAR